MFPGIKRLLVYKNQLTEVVPLTMLNGIEHIDLSRNNLVNLDNVNFSSLRTLKSLGMSSFSLLSQPIYHS
jgi:Leucine-rich repeat (LRR) protein